MFSTTHQPYRVRLVKRRTMIALATAIARFETFISFLLQKGRVAFQRVYNGTQA
jgi:hypothetical protein